MLLVGAHMSIAGGISGCYQRSAEIGGNAFQIFAKSPRGWNFVFDKISEQEYEKSIDNKNIFNQIWSVIHSIYLINLAKSVQTSKNDTESVIDDILIAQKLGIDCINVHLGKYGDLEKKQALENMVYNVGIILEKTRGYKPKFVFENTAGQGTEIGWDFEELGLFYYLLKDKFGKEYIEDRVRFCIDTAHAWGAGYDITNRENVVSDFDKFVGIDKLEFIHLNDSMAIRGSKLDRHASLGCGFIGINGLAQVIRRAEKNNKPIILETPKPEIWGEEINMIKGICDGSISKQKLDDFHKFNYKTQVLKKFTENGMTLFDI